MTPLQSCLKTRELVTLTLRPMLKIHISVTQLRTVAMRKKTALSIRSWKGSDRLPTIRDRMVSREMIPKTSTLWSPDSTNWTLKRWAWIKLSQLRFNLMKVVRWNQHRRYRVQTIVYQFITSTINWNCLKAMLWVRMIPTKQKIPPPRA